MHLQRNATQRNAYHHYLLKNNFKFYIFQFFIFKAVNFLSAVFGFAKIISFIKEKQNLCSFFYREKRTTPKADSRQKASSFVKRSKTTPFRIRNSLVKTFSQYLESPSLRGFAEAIYINWIATPSLRSARNDSAFFRHYERKRSNLFINKLNHASSCALKNQFEIISQSDYGFCYKNYFFNLNQVFRNSYDFGERFGRNLNYGFGKDYNCNFKKNCDYGFEKNCNGGFGKNNFWNCNFGFDFWNEIYGIGNSLVGFLFNRKTKKNKFMSAHSVGEGEQK